MWLSALDELWTQLKVVVWEVGQTLQTEWCLVMFERGPFFRKLRMMLLMTGKFKSLF